MLHNGTSTVKKILSNGHRSLGREVSMMFIETKSLSIALVLPVLDGGAKDVPGQIIASTCLENMD